MTSRAGTRQSVLRGDRRIENDELLSVCMAEEWFLNGRLPFLPQVPPGHFAEDGLANIPELMSLKLRNCSSGIIVVRKNRTR